MLRRVALSFAGILLSLSPVGLSAQQSRDSERNFTTHPEVKEIVFRGVKSFSKGDVRKALTTQESSCKLFLLRPICAAGVKSDRIYDRREFNADEFKLDVVRLLVFYFRRGYREAQVDTTVTRLGDDQVRITMSVTEGPPTVTQRVALEGWGRPSPRVTRFAKYAPTLANHSICWHSIRV